MKVFVAAFVLATLPVAAVAAGWTKTETRGVELNTLSTPELTLRIVCDPANAYGDAQNYVLADLEGTAVNGTVTIEADNRTASLVFEAGTAFKNSVEPEQWTKGLAILGSEAGFTFSNEGHAMKITPSTSLAHSCKS